jgi:site-specific DNA-methyltransferase (adenine-specific)
VLTVNRGPRSVSSDVAEVPLARLHPWDRNPRRITPERLRDLARSLEQSAAMLWARPLIALPDGTVIAGNQRLSAATELGWASIPAVFVDLDPAEARLWALKDNNAWGDWDEPVLAELLAELAGQGIDLLLTGFTSASIDDYLGQLVGPLDPDEAPPLPSGAPDSQLGEIYRLGPHRLACGDARDPELLARLFQEDEAAVLLTDPPYGVNYVGKTRRALRIRNDDGDGLDRLLVEAFQASDAVLEPCCRFYEFAPAGPQGTRFRLAVEQVGWEFHQALVWVKNAIVLGHSDHHFQHEDILYGWKPGPGRPGRGRHAGSRWYGDNRQSTALFHDRPVQSSEHPTMKPVALLEGMIRNSSRRGEVVFDPFAGSGSTLIACDRLGRRCLAVELDPGYCDVIRRRYQEQTGG